MKKKKQESTSGTTYISHSSAQRTSRTCKARHYPPRGEEIPHARELDVYTGRSGSDMSNDLAGSAD